MKRTTTIALFALFAAGCTGSFSTGKPTDPSSAGQPTNDEHAGAPSTDASHDRDGKVTGEGDGGGTPSKSELAAPAPHGAASTPEDCIPGNAKGHEKDKAQGEAKGHDKPPCPDTPAADPKPEPKPDPKLKAKADPPAADKATDKAAKGK